MNVKIPAQLFITTQSAEMHDRFANSMKGRTIEKIAGLEFVVISTSRDNQGVTAHLGEVTRTDQKWSGVGHPPARTVCEHRTGPGMNWSHATVLAHGEKKVFYRDRDGHEWSRLYDEIEFRPIRTPEQIAAEAREAGIKEMLSVCPYPGSHEQVGRVYAEALYDAGYRNGYRKPTDQ